MEFAIEKVQPTKRFQVLAYCGLILTYPFLMIPFLFKILLGVDIETLELMFK